MAARVTGCATIVGVDLRASRLELALELGATHVVDASQMDDLVGEVTRLTGGGAHYAVETTGSPAVLRQAVDALRVGGSCAVIGAPPMGTDVALDMNSILVGRTVRGTVEGDSIPQLFIPALLDLHVQGRFPFDRLIEVYDFERIDEAARDSEDGRVVKPVLKMS
jgi:aryl-alcohol dehydrogenase